jgi:ubiquitin carboxyl-terminal hydrolase 5/13
MASVLQGVFSLPAFKQRYAESTSHFENCPELLPAECLDCQMYKISDGLLSGRYSHPSTSTSGSADQDPAKRFQEGIKPNMFKALVGRGHEEFSTMRQQDSEEFLQHLIQRLRQEAKKKGLAEEREATETFKFGLEQKLVCSECKGVRLKVDRADSISLPVPVKEIEAPIVVGEGDGGSAAPTKQYEPVEFASCLNLMTEAEALEYNCPQCKKLVQALKSVSEDIFPRHPVSTLIHISSFRSSGFKSFPDVLVVHMRKFQLVNWVPTKLGEEW